MSVCYDFGENPNDVDLLKLYNFHQYCRAYIRGKLEGFKLDDLYIPEEEKAKVFAIAQSYFELAELYILEDN